MQIFEAGGEIGAPCGVPFRCLRARLVRHLPPLPPSSSTGVSGHALTGPGMRPSLGGRAMLFTGSACGISPKQSDRAAHDLAVPRVQELADTARRISCTPSRTPGMLLRPGPASNIGSSTSMADIRATRSRMQGMPDSRSRPGCLDGIMRRRTGPGTWVSSEAPSTTPRAIAPAPAPRSWQRSLRLSRHRRHPGGPFPGLPRGDPFARPCLRGHESGSRHRLRLSLCSTVRSFRTLHDPVRLLPVAMPCLLSVPFPKSGPFPRPALPGVSGNAGLPSTLPARPDPRRVPARLCRPAGRASRVATSSILHACQRHCPGGSGPVHLSPASRTTIGLPHDFAGSAPAHDPFEACSTFTRHPARMFAELSSAVPCRQGASACICLRRPPWLCQPKATIVGWVLHPRGRRAFPRRTKSSAIWETA